MRVMLVSTGLSLGGAEMQVVLLATRLKALGVDVKILTLIDSNAFEDELARNGIDHMALGMERRPSLRGLARFCAAMRAHRPDIVHSHMIHANLLARISRLFVRMPILICTAHAVYEIATSEVRLDKVRWRDWQYRLTDPLCNLTTHICKAGVERYLREKVSGPKKTVYMPNGIDTEKFKPLGRRTALREALGLREFTWLAVGRLDPAKDYGTLLSAAAELPKKKFHLLIAGAGDGLDDLKELAVRYGVENEVQFLGRRSDIPELMAASDAIVLSSLQEGLPLVLLEAHSAGLPAVATNVGGVSEIVRDGITGFLVPPRLPKELANAMARLMALDAKLREEMGNQARSFVVNYHSIEAVAQRWLDLYKGLMTGRKLAA